MSSFSEERRKEMLQAWYKIYEIDDHDQEIAESLGMDRHVFDRLLTDLNTLVVKVLKEGILIPKPKRRRREFLLTFPDKLEVPQAEWVVRVLHKIGETIDKKVDVQYLK